MSILATQPQYQQSPQQQQLQHQPIQQQQPIQPSAMQQQPIQPSGSYFGSQPPAPQQGFGQQPTQAVSEAILRVASATLATVLEQLQIDPQAREALCAQGQLSPEAYSNVLTVAAQRCAPIVAAVTTPQSGYAAQQPVQQPGIPQMPIGSWGQQPAPAYPQVQQPFAQSATQMFRPF